MRWFGQVYIPMMAVLGLLFIVLSFFVDKSSDNIMGYQTASTMMMTGAILAAGACIGGAIQQKKS
ncbi:MAG: hypothetical protein AB8C95_15075 [Phycisphaeraceae bacterium]